MDNLNVERRPVPGYEGLYSVTSKGEVISEERSFNALRHGVPKDVHIKMRTLKPGKTKEGYLLVVLSKDGIIKPHSVHRLVAKAFLPPPLPDQNEVRHKEGDPSKNTRDDLEWGTRTDNQRDRERHGTKSFGEKHGKATSTNDEILELKLRLKEGRSQTSLAKEFKMPLAKVNQIANNKIWRHIQV